MMSLQCTIENAKTKNNTGQLTSDSDES